MGFSTRYKKIFSSKEHYIPGKIPDCCKNESDPEKLCLECLEVLFDHHRQTCVLIRSGKAKSRRHEIYKKSVNSRKDLDYQTHSRKIFTEEQHEFLERWLLREFCQSQSYKHVDHCLRVLMQEVFIRVFMDFKGLTDFCEGEKQMAFHRIGKVVSQLENHRGL